MWVGVGGRVEVGKACSCHLVASNIGGVRGMPPQKISCSENAFHGLLRFSATTMYKRQK